MVEGTGGVAPVNRLPDVDGVRIVHEFRGVWDHYKRPRDMNIQIE